MAKLPWKRGESAAAPPALSSYLPSQPTDYTSMPIVEDEGLLVRFQRLPALARVAMVALPVLLVVGAIVAAVALAPAAPVEAVVAPPAPEVTVTEARVVNASEISISGQALNVPDGVPVSAQLLADGDALDWLDPEQATGVVEGERISLRVRKARSWVQQLQATAVYTVELTLAAEPPVKARTTLIVPEPVAAAFYQGGVAMATATPAPTKTPTPEPTPAPTVAGLPTLVVNNGASMLISPTLGSEVVAASPPGATYQPILRTPDNQFFLVHEGNRVGWLAAGDVTIDAAEIPRIGVTTPSMEAVQAGPLVATALRDGNIRYGPSLTTGTILGQLRAGQSVTLEARTADGQWYRVVAPEAAGWVNIILLTIEPDTAAHVPSSN